MSIMVNNIEFDFVRNKYGTHNWICIDYNDVTVIDEDGEEFESRVYLGNLQVLNFIHDLLDKVNTKQQGILYGLLKLVSDSYVESVGEQFARYDVSYRDSLTFSIGKRMRQYQLDKVADKVAESWD